MSDFDLTPIDHDPFESDRAPSNPLGFHWELNVRDLSPQELSVQEPDDRMQRFLQRVSYDPDEAAKRMFGATPSFADRLQARGGDKQGQVEDRTGNRQSGYEHMLAGYEI